MKIKNKFLAIFLSIVFFSLSILSCNNGSEATSSIPVVSKDTNVEISIVAAGDVLMHSPQILSGYDKKSGTYNFDNFFTYVKDYISSADYSICNSETSYLGDNSPFSGYPKFNSPKELLSSLKGAGFDALCSAHNHIIDMGDKGLESTGKAITNEGFDLLGIKNDANDKNYIIKDIKGIKVGITNYTYSTIDKNGYSYINGLPLSKGSEKKINLFSDSNIDKDITAMKETFDNMKKDGAEFTIFYVHWGNEYQTSPSPQQEKLAKMINSIGVNVILGSHPHVVQPIRTLKDEATGHETLVFYSLGNFISNQRIETMGNQKSEDGLMIKLKIIKDTSNNTVKLAGYESEPTWVYKYSDASGKDIYNIIPTEDVIENNNKDNFTQDVFNKIKNSNKSTEDIINS